MSTSPLRVLHVIGAMDRGGAETLVMNLYRNTDREKIQFDFLVNESRTCDYDEEIRSLGGRFFRVPRFNLANTVAYRRACREFFSTHPYQVVHGHIGFPAAIYLQLAKNAGAFAIAHSHAQNYPLSPQEAVFRCVSNPVRRVADYFLACSEQAGLDRFGKAVVSGPSFHVLKNGIDPDVLRFSQEQRRRIRKELGVSAGTPLFGHVGRLTPVKNHLFLLDVFSEVLRELPDAQLLLLGRGESEKDVRAHAETLRIGESVRFLGVRDDVASLLSAMDIFVFPSLREGLANATIEAQASGLPCLLSTGVPELAVISPTTKRLELGLGAKAWAEAAVEAFRAPSCHRESAVGYARTAGFDIKDSAAWLSDFYLAHAR